jgi:predicted TIM-barrel fold metal-dependent hydrolase
MSQILFGTDYPIEKIESTIDELPATKLTAAELHAIDCENAERLFPRLR